MAAVLVGSTGLVGSNILSTLLAHPHFTSVHAYSRKSLPQQDQANSGGGGGTGTSTAQKLKPITSQNTDEWPSLFPNGSQADTSNSVLFSALGTTKAQAGSLAGQRKIDYDLNLALAKAAKAAGCKTYVLISTTGASSGSMVPYTKMKGQLEDDVSALGFEYTFILRPGLILGARNDSRPAEYVAQRVFGALGAVSQAAQDRFAQDAATIARAAVHAAVQAGDGQRKPGKYVLGQADIVKLGRTEWTDGAGDKSSATASAAAPVPAASTAPAADAHVEAK